MMREFINIVENYHPPDLSAYELFKRVAALHHTPEDLESGDLESRIYKFTKYVFASLPLHTIDSYEWAAHDALVSEYAQRIASGETPPPIVYDMVDHSIIDGTHRAQAAEKADFSHIAAYVGLEENLDPNYDPDEEISESTKELTDTPVVEIRPTSNKNYREIWIDGSKAGSFELRSRDEFRGFNQYGKAKAWMATFSHDGAELSVGATQKISDMKPKVEAEIRRAYNRKHHPEGFAA